MEILRDALSPSIIQDIDVSLKREEDTPKTFISENEMSQMEGTNASLLYKFCTITCDDEIATKSKMQTVQDYLNDSIQNEKEFNSPMFGTGIFSHEKHAPIENWLMNSIENLRGNIIELPNDWVQILDISATKEWPLLFSLATERIEKEGLIY